MYFFSFVTNSEPKVRRISFPSPVFPVVYFLLRLLFLLFLPFLIFLYYPFSFQTPQRERWTFQASLSSRYVQPQNSEFFRRKL